jgi:peroxiredoxin-like protein
VDYERALVGTAILIESEMALFYECMLKCARKPLDTADIVREAIFLQQSSDTPSHSLFVREWAQIRCSVMAVTSPKGSEQICCFKSFSAAFPANRKKDMEEFHTYQVTAWWTSGRTGIAKCESAPHALHFTAPLQFGGLEGRWTPEDLLLTAVGSCYATTFRALADYSKFEYADLEVQVAGTVQKVASGYSFSEIVTRPALAMVREEDRERAVRLLQKAQDLCLVGRALSVKHTFEPSIRFANISPTP